jgi:hypothetical protein
LENLHKTKTNLNFGYQNADCHPVEQLTISANPFAALEADNPEADETKDNLEEMREGWTFQGRRKHTPKIASPKQAPPQSLIPTPNLEVIPRGRRKRMHSDVHCSYFTSLGISTSPGQEHAKAMIWPVLSREKSE